METNGITVMELVKQLPDIKEHMSRDREILPVNEYPRDTNDQFSFIR
jgi:hypothetical protein